MREMKRSLKKKNRASVKPLPVPTEKDWGDYRLDLDQKHAHDVFAGHTNEQMQRFFRQNPIEMTDELRWMPDVPFRYYLLGFRDFIMAKDFGFLNGSDAASCFLGLVLEKLEKQSRLIVPIMPELLPTIEHVARNQSLFEAAPNVYGNFIEKLGRIRALYKTPPSPAPGS
jgi:hypothetical protein